MDDTPRISDVAPTGLPKQISVTRRSGTWPNGRAVAIVDLDGWVEAGREILAPLKRPEVFARAACGEHGASVTWDDGEGDLSIDAVHLEKIIEEMQAFGPEELARWQRAIGISNSEAAGLFAVSRSTWATWKAGSAPIPHPVRMLCRSITRDPLTLHAWLRSAPPPGRPRRAA